MRNVLKDMPQLYILNSWDNVIHVWIEINSRIRELNVLFMNILRREHLDIFFYVLRDKILTIQKLNEFYFVNLKRISHLVEEF